MKKSRASRALTKHGTKVNSREKLKATRGTCRIKQVLLLCGMEGVIPGQIRSKICVRFKGREGMKYLRDVNGLKSSVGNTFPFFLLMEKKTMNLNEILQDHLKFMFFNSGSSAWKMNVLH